MTDGFYHTDTPSRITLSCKHWLNVMVNITFDTTISYPVPISFPCQRVVRELGAVGQYGGFIQFPLSRKDYAEHEAFLLPMKKSAK